MKCSTCNRQDTVTHDEQHCLSLANIKGERSVCLIWSPDSVVCRPSTLRRQEAPQEGHLLLSFSPSSCAEQLLIHLLQAWVGVVCHLLPRVLMDVRQRKRLPELIFEVLSESPSIALSFTARKQTGWRQGKKLVKIKFYGNMMKTCQEAVM